MTIYAANPDNWIDIAIILGFFLIVAFPVHEFFHAYMAYRLGDGTAKMFGKLTLNPIAHFHPVGGWMLVFSTLLFGIPLGFAATPVNPSNLRGRHGEAYVAAAGPLSNFLLAAVFAIPLRCFIAADTGPELALVGIRPCSSSSSTTSSSGCSTSSRSSRSTAARSCSTTCRTGRRISSGRSSPSTASSSSCSSSSLQGGSCNPISDAIYSVLVG